MMEKRFLSKIHKTETCWNWTACRNVDGYGRFGIDKKLYNAHRVAYELWKEPIPANMIVRHMCDNPACVNPAHLELGTHQDNVQDKVERGRQQRGIKHHKSKLTDDDVREIKILRGFGFTYKELSSMYGIGPSPICLIVKGVRWKHIIG
mgnify:CR=1 FL=1